MLAVALSLCGWLLGFVAGVLIERRSARARLARRVLAKVEGSRPIRIISRAVRPELSLPDDDEPRGAA